MKKTLLLFVTIIGVGMFGGSLRAQSPPSPLFGGAYVKCNGQTKVGSPSLSMTMYTNSSLEVDLSGSNMGGQTSAMGGITLEIREALTSNVQMSVTSVTANGSEDAQVKYIWWAGDLLGTGQTAQYLHVEPTWTNWPAGQEYFSNVVLTALQPGTYHLYAKMYLQTGTNTYARDPLGTTPNTDDQGEGTYLIGTVVVSGYPDLVIQSPALGSTLLQSGSSSNVVYNVYNQGNQVAGPFRVGIYLSTSQYSPGTLLTTQSVSGLGVNSTYSGNNLFTIPSNTPSGNYYIVVYADDQNQVAESNENNNTNGTPISVTLFAVTNIVANVSPTTLNSVSSPITTSGTFSGSGSGQISYTWEWQQPGSTTWSSMSGLTYHTTMTNGSASDSPASYNPFTKGGTYNLRIHATSPNDITSNAVTVNVPLPDLIVPSVSLSNSSLRAGQNVTVNYTVNNQNHSAATSFRIGFYLSTTQYSPQTLLTSTTLSSLGAGSSYSGTQTVTVPSNTAAGSYYIVVFADDQSQVTESNENNNTNGAGFTVTVPTTSVTVTTDPSGLAISVDGTNYTSPQTFSNWIVGSSHTIGTTSTQSGGSGTQYVWSSWSDGLSVSHTITAPSTNTTYAASFTTQYYLTMTAGANGSVTPPSGYYNSGASIQISTVPNAQYTFSGWTGSGIGSYNGSNNPASVTMNGPITESAAFSAIPATLPDLTIKSLTYSPQNPTTADNITFTAVIWNNSSVSCAVSVASLKVGGESNPPTYNVPGLAAQGTYSISRTLNLNIAQSYGATVTADVNNSIAESNESNNSATIVFNVTQPVSGNITVTTDPTGLSITVDGTNYTSPQSFNWTQGSNHTVATTPTQSGSTGTQYVWSSWSDGQAISHTISAPSGNATYTADFTTQYYLTMSPPTNGSASPQSGYFNSGASVQITATANSGYTFAGWAGNGSGSYTGTGNPANVTMNAPITESASFNFSTPGQTVSVALPKVSGVKGSQTSVPIVVGDLTGLNITAFQFKIYYDKNVVYLTGVDNTNTLTSGTSPTVNADTASGVLSVAWASSGPLSGSGNLLDLKFQFNNAGTSTLTTAGSGGETFLFNSGNPVASVASGNVSTTPVLLGDVDGNGMVQAIDASLILQEVVGLKTFTPTQMAAADVNHDGVVGAYDASWILYYVVYGQWPSTSVTSTENSELASSLTLGSPSSTDSTLSIPLIASNTSGLRSAYTVINLPSFAQYDGVTSDLPEGWHLVAHYQNDKLRVAVAGIKHLPEGTIASLRLKVQSGRLRGSLTGDYSLNDRMTSSLSSVDISEKPVKFQLSYNYPNPFNPSTKIEYALPKASNVSLVVYNVMGEKVKTLVNGYQQPGNHEITWDGTGSNGEFAASGLYFCRIVAGDHVATIKMELLK